jgi:oligopeptide/dipeptide ABC transporter ATP-binding protein
MLPIIPGAVPGLADFPQGCRFQSRCTYAVARCFQESPAEVEVSEGADKVTDSHKVACHRHKEIYEAKNHE